ncbi:hypothetical protein [Streptomyces sp. NPDC048256]|uniref:hypothetical protein n=1 Tax=unclassified Streptomyces TaxID=2593676 RepID=UPI0033F43F04
MARELVLGVDAGNAVTPVTKAVLVDAAGRPVAHGSGTLPLNTRGPRWADRDMDEGVETAHQAIAACLARASPDAGRSVAAVGPAEKDSVAHGHGPRPRSRSSASPYPEVRGRLEPWPFDHGWTCDVPGGRVTPPRWS